MYAALDTTAGGGGRRGRVSRSAQAYATLKHRLLIGDFQLGERLGEVALATSMDMSRTPVRDALSRLHAEGLVVRQSDGSFSPAAPDLHTIGELYEVRRALEFSALHRADHDRDALDALITDWEAMEVPGSDEECSPDFVLHDEEFHVRLASSSGNQALVGVLTGVNERIRVVRMQDFITVDRVAATIDEHVGIARALLDDGSERAAEHLGRHLDISEQVVEQRAALALSRMIGPRRD